MAKPEVGNNSRRVDAKAGKVSARLALKETAVYYLNLVDNRDLVVKHRTRSWCVRTRQNETTMVRLMKKMARRDVAARFTPHSPNDSTLMAA